MDIVAVKDSELERYVTKIMLEIGVPAHLKGYHYLRDAIILSGKDMEVVSSVTKLLYPTIANISRPQTRKWNAPSGMPLRYPGPGEMWRHLRKYSDIQQPAEGIDRRTANISHVSRTTSDWIIRLCNILSLLFLIEKLTF